MKIQVANLGILVPIIKDSVHSTLFNTCKQSKTIWLNKNGSEALRVACSVEIGSNMTADLLVLVVI
jgi:hypothetical protein